MKNKKLIALISSVFLLSSLIVTKPVKAEILPDRIYGNNRYETSSEISKKGFEKAESVVITRGDDFADALCAAPLAKQLNAPIILTEKNRISESALKEIKRLNAKKAIIVGLDGVVSDKVKNKLESEKINVERIGGKNRYETSVKVAEKLNNTSSIVITTGKNFADSLSISTIAANKNMAILLNDKNNLSNEIKDYIKEKSIENSYVLGGEKIISKSVEKELPKAERIAGQDRYETNLEILKKFEKDLKFDKVYVTIALGEKDFADGLAVAPLAAREPSPLVLVGNKVSNEMKTYIKDKTNKDSEIIALGSEKIVSQRILNSLSWKAQMDEVNKITEDLAKKVQAKKDKNEWDAIVLKMAKESIDKNYKSELENKIKNKGDKINLGESAKSILAVAALKEDPTKFAGVNLVEKASKLLKEEDGFTNNKIWGIIALEAVGAEYDKDAAFEYLRNEQKKDGGFSWVEGSDESDEWPDMTAMAVYAMTMMGKTSYDKEVSDALKFLKNYLVKSEKNKEHQTLESLAQIVMAAISAKDDLKNYKINGNNIIDEILTYKAEDGGFKNKKKDKKSNDISTNQALQALLFYKNGMNLYEALNNYGKFTLVISKDNGKSQSLNKKLNIEEGKSSLDYLKENADVELNGTFISGINGVKGVMWNDLTDEEKINDISGKDWFIFINKDKANVGADGILPKNGDTITFDYHAYDWKEFAAPGQTEMPIVIKVPNNIEAGKEFEIKTLCGWTALVKAKVTVNGQEYETDMNGKLKLKLDKYGKYKIKVEKSGYTKETEIEIIEVTENNNETTNVNLQKAA